MANLEEATLGGGCFWCLEGVFNRMRGVSEAVSGYAGGHVPNPSYEAVCAGRTGHAEVVRVRYDPEVLDYRTLLGVFFTIHDPTQLNRQGPDVGTQYRSIILTHNDAQATVAREVRDRIQQQPEHSGKRVVTEIEPLEAFYPAELHHQRFYETRPDAPYCSMMIVPKIRKARERFPGCFDAQ